MKGIIRIFTLALSAAIAVSCSCGRIGDISLNQYKVVTLEPHGMRNICGTVSLELVNNGPTLAFPVFEGEVYRNDSRVGSFRLTEPLAIVGPGTFWTDLHAVVDLDPEVSVFAIMGMARHFDISQYSITFDTQVSVGRFHKRIQRENMSLKKLSEKKKKE